jgi:cellulase (glycosyl hydrolase family 5)
MRRVSLIPHVLMTLTTCLAASGQDPAAGIQAVRSEMPWIKVSPDNSGFVLDRTSPERPFRPMGFNYDHDEQGRLLEDYWELEWPKVESDFAEMKDLGANVVRIHLQIGKFMEGPEQPCEKALQRLGKVVALAEAQRLYLDLTGLGCYHKTDVPDWYDELSEQGRWKVQARFWEAVAESCRASPAIFCYDLMNEPVVPGGRRADREWLGAAFAGKHFVQFVTLDQADRARPDIARAWIRHLVSAIRKVDTRHLISVGLVDWSLERQGLTSGFVPEKIAGELDFISVHIYPETDKLAAALETLDGFAIGKPVVVEETFPLKCSTPQLEEFMDLAGKQSSGWISFYWGKSPEELRRASTLGDAILLEWLTRFSARAKQQSE